MAIAAPSQSSMSLPKDSVTRLSPFNTIDQSLNTLQLTKLLRGLLSQFPNAIPDLNADVQRPNPHTEKFIKDTIQLWDLGITSSVLHRAFIYGHIIATTAYHHVQSPELQAQIGLLSGLAILVDDGTMGIPSLQEFVTRFTLGIPQLHPSLDRFAETARCLGKYFTPYGANAILTSTIDFVTSELFEREVSHIDLSEGSIRYADYMRGKTGYVEAYAVFVWPKDEFPDTQEYIQAFPDTMQYLSLINDIFSYYKESQGGETGTYVLNYAAIHEITQDEALERIIDYTIALVHRVRRILGEGKARDAWESFAAGYIRYHLRTERYRLVEILPDLLA